MTAGSPSPLSPTRSPKPGARGAGTTKKLNAVSGGEDPPYSTTSQLAGEGSPPGLYWGEGTGLKVRTRALYLLLVTPVLLFTDFQTPGPLSACPARLHRPILLPTPFQTQTKYPLSTCLQSCSRPGWGWEAGCQGKYEAPASRRLPAPARSAHTLHSRVAAKRGRRRRGGSRGDTTPSSGREECGNWVGLLSFGVGANCQPATDPKGANQLWTCQKRQSGAREIYKVKPTSSALAGGAGEWGG